MPKKMMYVRHKETSYFLLYMANDVYFKVNYCCLCAQDGSQMKHNCKLQLFPADGALKLLAMYIFWPLPKTKSGKQQEVTMTYWYSKLTLATPTRKISSTHFFHCIPWQLETLDWCPKLCTERQRLQVTSILFTTLWTFLEVKKLTTTVYCALTNPQLGR